ncbi:MAG: hypothetical protein QXX57_00490 [Nitrososphaerota archaeon]
MAGLLGLRYSEPISVGGSITINEDVVTAAWVSVTTTLLDNGEELRYVVPPEEIVSGGPPKDGVPPRQS